MSRGTETALVVTRRGQKLREPAHVVRVMARAEGYAMVRRPGAEPCIVLEADLQPVALKRVAAPRERLLPLAACQSDRDGECSHRSCTQVRDGEPAKSWRSCPLPDPTRDAC